ncbi:MAG: hypothetical protein AABW59_01975 [archaeon]
MVRYIKPRDSMVLESLLGEKNIRKYPFLIGILSVMIALGGIFFAYTIFPAHASILAVAFITIGLVPIMHNILATEEEEEAEDKHSSVTFFARHFDLIQLYVWIFIGIIIAFALAYAVAPSDVKPVMFEEQIKAFCTISGGCDNGIPNSVTGKVTGMALVACDPQKDNVLNCGIFILETNGWVLIFVIALSLLYGAGAIFIIAWNASILGLFFGEMFLVGEHLRGIGFLQTMLIGHGPPELFAYVFGALAGAILSAAVSKGHLWDHHVGIILRDVSFLSVLAAVSVVYGAFVEAVGIMGMTNEYFILGFIYVVAVVIVVIFYGRQRHSPLSQRWM